MSPATRLAMTAHAAEQSTFQLSVGELPEWRGERAVVEVPRRTRCAWPTCIGISLSNAKPPGTPPRSTRLAPISEDRVQVRGREVRHVADVVRHRDHARDLEFTANRKFVSSFSMLASPMLVTESGSS